MLTKIEFAEQKIPFLNERYEVLCTKPEDLIGKKVMSIRAGYGNRGGQVMVISDATKKLISFVSCKESLVHKITGGWQSPYETRADDFIFYTKELLKQYLNLREDII